MSRHISFDHAVDSIYLVETSWTYRGEHYSHAHVCTTEKTFKKYLKREMDRQSAEIGGAIGLHVPYTIKTFIYEPRETTHDFVR
jgi:hypothetical protein